MKTNRQIQLDDVVSVYSGPEFELWELLMGEQVHIGGLLSSQQLAELAGIRPGDVGVDLCCCTGAGMRFLTRMCGVSRMIGVDATDAMVQLGRERCQRQGLADRADFRLADACRSGIPDAEVDFVWGEDAWCYVADKRQLIVEAVRIVKSGGVIAFTDWVEGSAELSEDEADRLLCFMKFPSVQSLDGYRQSLIDCGCEVSVCEDTGLFVPNIDRYLELLRSQLRFDALTIVGFDADLLDSVITEIQFMQELARAGKFMQGRLVARKCH